MINPGHGLRVRNGSEPESGYIFGSDSEPNLCFSKKTTRTQICRGGVFEDVLVLGLEDVLEGSF